MTRILVLLLFTPLCFAGGSYSQMRVMEFDSSGSDASFTVKFTNDIRFNESCEIIKVRLNYSLVPWYSWVPFVRSNHPNSEQTKKALLHIEKAFKHKREVNFGYMGNGLVSTENVCEYLSKGLSFEEYKGVVYIMSFYSPV